MNLSAFVEWLQSHSIMLTEAIRQLLIVGLTFGVLQWTTDQLGVVLSAVSAVLALVTAKTNVSHRNVDQIVEKRVSDRMTGTGSGTGPGHV